MAIDPRVSTAAAAYTPTASPDGATINTPTGWLIDAQGNRFALVSSAQHGMQIRINAFVDTATANVVRLVMDEGRCHQQNLSLDWYAYNGSPGDWSKTQAPGEPETPTDPGTPSGGTEGILRVQNGRILRPDGSIFHGRGPNIRLCNWPDNQSTVIHHPLNNLENATPLLHTFPGTNLVRFDCYEAMTQLGLATMETCCPYIDALVAHGIVVEVECHVYPAVLQGAELERVLEWYRPFARHYRGQANVIWGTQNEPGGPPDDEISAIYDAIRNEGNDNVILICPFGGHGFNDMNPANYQRYRNVAWDMHFYGWMADYSLDQAHNDWSLRRRFDDGLQFQTQDGDMPMIVGEFGSCGFGSTNSIYVENNHFVDPNWEQIINAVYRANYLSGWTQWFWNTWETSHPSNSIDLMLLEPYDGSRLSAYGGEQCKAAIAAGAPG